MSDGITCSTIRLPEAFRSGKVLVLGMGGGCDIVTAYVVSKQLPGLSSTAVWGNTKRNVDRFCAPLVGVVDAASMQPSDVGVWCIAQTTVTADGAEVVENRPVPLEAGASYYGGCGIDASVPRETVEGVPAPLIVKLPYVGKEAGARVDEGKLQTVASYLREELGFTAVVGVDAGGDSVTGGIDHNGDPSTGTDQMCQRMLAYTGLPFMQVVCGVGCDGESTIDTIRTAFDDLLPKLLPHRPLGTTENQSTWEAALHPMGTAWAEQFERLAGVLGPTRTPAIMAAAVRAQQQTAAKQPADGTAAHQRSTAEPVTIVNRGLHPSLPTRWLARYVAIVHTVG